MSLQPPESVRTLQETLHAKAQRAPSYRFYALYDKLYRPDVLAHAYACGRANAGAAGVDGQTFADIEASGRGAWLGALAADLRARTYRPQAVRRVWIPKPDGKQRPLGIPTVTDRVVQMAAVLVLGPIFETDLPPEQYAYRPGRGALDAVRHVQRLLNAGYTDVVDADLSGYFDSIPHAELMKSVARRVSDGRMLALVKQWLATPVEETDDWGRRQRTTRNRDEGRGTPQGSPVSPLLANGYMRRFLLGWKALGHERRWEARIVNYADDFVICCRGLAAQALAAMRDMMTRLKLTVNERKTRRCRLPDERFDFLGYTFGRGYRYDTGQAYLGVRPSTKAIRRIMQAVHDDTGPGWRFLALEDLVGRINDRLRGWANYFCLGSVGKAYRRVDYHVGLRLRQWWCGKHQRPGRGYAALPAQRLYGPLGLLRLQP
jgi:RNA-directed DNA polymerase